MGGPNLEVFKVRPSLAFRSLSPLLALDSLIL